MSKCELYPEDGCPVNQLVKEIRGLKRNLHKLQAENETLEAALKRGTGPLGYTAEQIKALKDK